MSYFITNYGARRVKKFFNKMDSRTYSFSLEEPRSVFTSATALTTLTISETRSLPLTPLSVTSEPFIPMTNRSLNLHSHSANELLDLIGQQEPRAGDTAPSTAELDDTMMDFRMNGSEINFDEPDPSQNFSMGNSGRESVASRASFWNNHSASAPSSPHPNDQMVTFDFLVKSVSAANNYVSMLTREQLSVLQSLRPSLLYDFLQEVAKVRHEKRSRRALPNECAFCKNNGEIEEHYTSHALKDWRGRVECPVLRAFRCPRCGSTGDRAHTIKYCPENHDNERLSSRRRMPPSSLFVDQHGMHSPLGSTPPTPLPSPATGPVPQNSVWSFNMN